MRRPSSRLIRAAAPFLALALGACALEGRDRRSDRYGGDDYAGDRYPQRVHYRDSQDAANVHYYDRNRPDVRVDRRVYREDDGRTYYFERSNDGDHGDRRTYFDDDAARRRRTYDGRDADDSRWDDSGRDRR